MSTSTDLDEFRGSNYAGLYYFSSGSTPTNAPSDYQSNNGMVDITYLSGISTTVQWIYQFSGGITHCWSRRYYNSWSSWATRW